MIDGGGDAFPPPSSAFMAAGIWQGTGAAPTFSTTGAPFYDTYETADGRHVAIGCLEPQFFAEFARLLPLDEKKLAARQYNVAASGKRCTNAIAARIKQKTRDEWTTIFEGTDACVAPVLSFTEAARTSAQPEPRETFVETNGLTKKDARPGPRASRAAGHSQGPPRGRLRAGIPGDIWNRPCPQRRAARGRRVGQGLRGYGAE